MLGKNRRQKNLPKRKETILRFLLASVDSLEGTMGEGKGKEPLPTIEVKQDS